jgi:hypothetical protein
MEAMVDLNEDMVRDIIGKRETGAKEVGRSGYYAAGL